MTPEQKRRIAEGVAYAEQLTPLVESNIIHMPPPAASLCPLSKYPPEMTVTEEIKGTKYTVRAHFREDGQDLLTWLLRLMDNSVAPHAFDETYD